MPSVHSALIVPLLAALMLSACGTPAATSQPEPTSPPRKKSTTSR